MSSGGRDFDVYDRLCPDCGGDVFNWLTAGGCICEPQPEPDEEDE